jgi:FemAB-related protein (PEP-CTERM system-associated)
MRSIRMDFPAAMGNGRETQIVAGGGLSEVGSLEVQRGFFMTDGFGQAVAIRPLTAELRVMWDGYARGQSEGSPFHESLWLEAGCRTYGHRLQALAAVNDQGAIAGILPTCQVSGPFTGRALISAPYGVYGRVLADSDTARDALLSEARRRADELGVRYLEIRQGQPLEGFEGRCQYYTFRRTLPERPEDVLGTFPKKARAAVRHAIDRYKLTARFGPELLDTFYRLYTVSLRRLASPGHSKAFLKRLVEGYGPRCLVQVVYHEGTPVAGCLSLTFRNQVLPYFAGIDDRYSRLNTSNFLYYSLMEEAVRRGLQVFDFGRTRQDNEGGCQFKINQGFEPEPLHYSYYIPRGGTLPDLRPSNPKFSLAQAVWKRLPLPVAAAAGGIVTRWLP